VYLDVRDGQGPAAGLRAADLYATLGDRALPVDTVGAAGGTAYVFLVDVSRSLRRERFDQIRGAVAGWARGLGPDDEAALVAFGDDVRQVVGFGAGPDVFQDSLAALAPTAGTTRLHDGLLRALALGRVGRAGLPDRRVVVTLSDGLDDAVGGATQAEVLEALRADPVPVYALGFHEPPPSAAHRAGLQALGEIARTSGGAFLDVGGQPLAERFAQVRERIESVRVAALDCAACPTDGGVHRLQVAASVGGLRVEDGLALRLTPPERLPPPLPAAAVSEERDGWDGVAGYGWLAALALVLVVGGALVLARRPRTERPPPETAGPDDEGELAPDGKEPDAPDAPVHAPPAGRAAPPPRPTRPVEPSGPEPLSVRLTPLGAGGADGAHTLRLGSRTTLGRDAARADVAFPEEPGVSGAHAALVPDGAHVAVEDLGSTNGTFVNGVPIRGRHRLESGDVVRLGTLDLRFRILDPS
jgi:Mg-chelatase subunit ChlD